MSYSNRPLFNKHSYVHSMENVESNRRDREREWEMPQEMEKIERGEYGYLRKTDHLDLWGHYTCIGSVN